MIGRNLLEHDDENDVDVEIIAKLFEGRQMQKITTDWHLVTPAATRRQSKPALHSEQSEIVIALRASTDELFAIEKNVNPVDVNLLKTIESYLYFNYTFDPVVYDSRKHKWWEYPCNEHKGFSGLIGQLTKGQIALRHHVASYDMCGYEPTVRIGNHNNRCDIFACTSLLVFIAVSMFTAGLAILVAYGVDASAGIFICWCICFWSCLMLYGRLVRHQEIGLVFDLRQSKLFSFVRGSTDPFFGGIIRCLPCFWCCCGKYKLELVADISSACESIELSCQPIKRETLTCLYSTFGKNTTLSIQTQGEGQKIECIWFAFRKHNIDFPELAVFAEEIQAWYKCVYYPCVQSRMSEKNI